MRSRFIKALNNRFYVKFMQLEIGLLLVKKGIYQYEYMSSWDKFKETKLPPEESFYSKLNMSGVSSENYKHRL